MFFRPSSVTLILALLALGTPIKRGSANVESDISGLTTKSQSLDDSIKAFPNSGGTLEQAWNIHTATVDIASSVKTATNDLNASPVFTDKEGGSIVKLVDEFALVVQTTCDDLVTKKQAITTVGVAGIAVEDLKTLKTNADAFGKALLAKLPADAQGNAQKPLDMVGTALIYATNAFDETK